LFRVPPAITGTATASATVGRPVVATVTAASILIVAVEAGSISLLEAAAEFAAVPIDRPVLRSIAGIGAPVVGFIREVERLTALAVLAAGADAARVTLLKRLRELARDDLRARQPQPPAVRSIPRHQDFVWPT
jgi:hypothetical protein